MVPDMQHLQAPPENLQTWNRVVKIIAFSCGAIAVLLIFMAITLT